MFQVNNKDSRTTIKTYLMLTITNFNNNDNTLIC